MTNKEAIKKLEWVLRNNYIEDVESAYEYIMAIKMAIEALKLVNDFESAQIITGGRLNGRTYAYKCGLADGQRLANGEKIFNVLSSVQQKQRTGRWEWVQHDSNPSMGDWHCSECDRIVSGAITLINPVCAYKYCPKCGAKMEEGDYGKIKFLYKDYCKSSKMLTVAERYLLRQKRSLCMTI